MIAFYVSILIVVVFIAGWMARGDADDYWMRSRRNRVPRR